MQTTTKGPKSREQHKNADITTLLLNTNRESNEKTFENSKT
jgi:hypothetical protein